MRREREDEGEKKKESEEVKMRMGRKGNEIKGRKTWVEKETDSGVWETKRT